MAIMLQEGAIFAGRYRIERCIAAGGMGAVYEAVHIETERRRALKIMLPQFVSNDDFRQRFKLEARVAAHIESEHIVEVFDAGFDEATQMPFMVMELLRGEELEARLRRAGRFSPLDAATYLHQVALALDKTHRGSIVHRDLKPANIFLTAREDGAPRIKILDFGVAKLIAEGATSAGVTTSVGTPLYMAPEQLRAGRITPAVDIFAVGMLAFTFLVGVAYWIEEMRRSGDIFSYALATGNGPQEPASARAARHGVALPPAFDAWFARATAFNPEDRFPSATAAVGALAEVLGVPLPGGGAHPSAVMAISSAGPAGGPATGGSLSGDAISVIPVERRRGPLLIALTLAALLLGAGGALALLGRGEPSATTPEKPPAEVEAPASTAAPEPTIIPVAPTQEPTAESSAAAPPEKPAPPPVSASVNRPPARPPQPTATTPHKTKYTRD